MTRAWRAGARVAAALAAVCWTSCSHAAPGGVDLQGAAVEPLSAGVPTVLLFTRSDCPISNRYAPEVQRLAAHYADLGVAFWLVYADPDEPSAAIRTHLEDYGYDLPVVRDLDHALVRHAGARVTPEAALYSAAGELVYRGRIDDRYLDFNRKRNLALHHDLQDAIDALLGGAPAKLTTTPVVGCYIADLR